jgi:hypothetical protein
MIERASDRFAAPQGGKIAPRPTGCGKLLPHNPRFIILEDRLCHQLEFPRPSRPRFLR